MVVMPSADKRGSCVLLTCGSEVSLSLHVQYYFSRGSKDNYNNDIIYTYLRR